MELVWVLLIGLAAVTASVILGNFFDRRAVAKKQKMDENNKKKKNNFEV